jgi:hypothetical protein
MLPRSAVCGHLGLSGLGSARRLPSTTGIGFKVSEAHLNEYGLWRWHSSEQVSLETQPDDNDNDNAEERRWRHQNGYWELVEGENTDRILDELELGSIAPQRRNFRFLSKRRASARASGVKGTIRSRGIHDGQERARGDEERKSQVQYIWDQHTCTVVYFLTIMTSFSVINPILSEP